MKVFKNVQAANFNLLKKYYQEENKNILDNNAILDHVIDDIYAIRTSIDWHSVFNFQVAYYYKDNSWVEINDDIFNSHKYSVLNDVIVQELHLLNNEKTKYRPNRIINSILLAKIRNYQIQNDFLAKTWVSDWLKSCSSKGIEPWKYDFKQCYLEKDIAETQFASDRIKLFDQYKNNSLRPELNEFNFSKKPGNNSSADCDKEAYPFYKVLGWQESVGDQIRGDTINSFATTYKKLPASDFSLLKDDLEKFASLTHSIGNFTTLPYTINTKRGIGKSKDYWDITLKLGREDLLQSDQTEIKWQQFIQKYYLQPYVNQQYEPQELWTNHFYSNVLPQKTEDFQQFYSHVNLLIIERGKWITKILCEKLGLTDLSFYVDNQLNQMEEIGFFNDIIKK